MAGLDSFIALLSGGADGIDSEMERRRKQALLDAQSQRQDREGRRKAQSDVLDLQQRGFDEVSPEMPDDWQRSHGASPDGTLPPGSIALDDYDGKPHHFAYNKEHDPSYVRARDLADTAATERAAAQREKQDEQDRLLAAKQAAQRIAAGKPRPGDEDIANPDALSLYENRNDNRDLREQGITVQRALAALQRDRFDHHVTVDDQLARDRMAGRTNRSALRPRTQPENDAYAVMMDGKTLTDADKNQLGDRITTLVDAGVNPEQARLQALRDMGKITGGGRAKVSAGAALLRDLAAKDSAASAPSQPAAKPVTRPTAPPTQPAPRPQPSGRAATASAPPARAPQTAPATTPAPTPDVEAKIADLRRKAMKAIAENKDSVLVQQRLDAMIEALRHPARRGGATF